MRTNLLSGPANKATWPAAINAAVLLINGRLPEPYELREDELGLVMIILGCLIAYFVPNKPTTPSQSPQPAAA